MLTSDKAHRTLQASVRRTLKTALVDGALLEVTLFNGERLEGYWVCSLGARTVCLSNATIESCGESPVTVNLADLRRVTIVG